MGSINKYRSYKEALDNKTILVTGGTVSFCHQVVEKILEGCKLRRACGDADSRRGKAELPVV